MPKLPPVGPYEKGTVLGVTLSQGTCRVDVGKDSQGQPIILENVPYPRGQKPHVGDSIPLEYDASGKHPRVAGGRWPQDYR